MEELNVRRKIRMLVGVVHSIVTNGRHGPYAITYSEWVVGSITFRLDKPFWGEADWPELGTVVVLHNVRLKRAGWRAYYARYYRPHDQQRACNKNIETLFLPEGCHEDDTVFVLPGITAGINLKTLSKKWAGK